MAQPHLSRQLAAACPYTLDNPRAATTCAGTAPERQGARPHLLQVAVVGHGAVALAGGLHANKAAIPYAGLTAPAAPAVTR